MLTKLRIKFIALNMVSVACVIVVAFASICIINYQQDKALVEAALDSAIINAAEENGSAQGDSPTSPNQEESPDNTPEAAPGEDDDTAELPSESSLESQDEETETSDQLGVPPTIGGEDAGEQIIPVAVYVLDAEGSANAVTDFNTATISEEVLDIALEALDALEDGDGVLSEVGLFYEKRTIDDTVYLAFADESSASGWKSLAATLTFVGLATLAVFFIISLFFSRWALRPVEEAWGQQKRFIADASHDLKTPITVILANTSIVLEHPERSVASQSQWLESTQHEASTMQELVGDLLLLAQIDEGAATSEHEPVDFSELVEGELLQFESVAFERAIEFETSVEGNICLMGSEVRLRRLVNTLIDNACKYAGVAGRVEVSLVADERTTTMSVRNTGPVIDPEDLKHVFDRFYRADKARTDEDGHGLGLAIAKSIAEEHGGTLTVTSDEEHGTTFAATLPLQNA